MIDMARPGKAAESFAQPGNAIGQIGWDGVQQMLDRSQTIAGALMDFGNETLGFFAARIDRDNEALSGAARCRGVSEMLELEAQWWRRTMDDYASQMNRVLTLNANLLGCLTERPIHAETPPKPQAAAEPTQAQRQAA